MQLGWKSQFLTFLCEQLVFYWLQFQNNSSVNKNKKLFWVSYFNYFWFDFNKLQNCKSYTIQSPILGFHLHNCFLNLKTQISAACIRFLKSKILDYWFCCWICLLWINYLPKIVYLGSWVLLLGSQVSDPKYIKDSWFWGPTFRSYLSPIYNKGCRS